MMLKRDVNYNDIIDRIEALEERIEDLRDFSRPTETIIYENAGETFVLNGWVNSATVLRSTESEIVFDPTVPSIEVSGTITNALLVDGSDGSVTLGGLGEGVVSSDASGVLSVGSPSGTLPIPPVAEGDMILADGTPEWAVLTLGAAAGYALVTTATTAAWDQTPTWTGLHIFGAGWALSGGTGDLNGNDLILDTDGDSYLHASDDDVIDLVLAGASGEFAININGAEAFTFTDNAFNVLSGSAIIMADDTGIGLSGGGGVFWDSTPNPDQVKLTSIDFNLVGNDLIIDTDGDSYLHASADDVIDFVLATAMGELGITINGAEDFTFTANALNVKSGSGVNMADACWIGISGNEIITFNAAGTIVASGISGFYVENGDYIGVSGCAWLFDSGNSDISTTAKVGIGTTSVGNKLDIVTGATLYSAVHIGEAIDEGAYITSITDSMLILSGGVEYDNGSWRARATSAAIFSISAGAINFRTDASLTDGNTYSPSVRMTIDTSGDVSIGDTAIGARLGVSDSDAVTAAITDIAILEHLTSGTAAADFGAGLLYQLEDGGGSSHDAMRISTVWENAGASLSNAEFRLDLDFNGTMGEAAVIVGPGLSTVAGNQRGEAAVDLQSRRSAAAQVASGDASTISGGYGNTASGAGSTVLAGQGNTASAQYSTTVGGFNNTASAQYSLAAGYTATASHIGSYVWAGSSTATVSWGNNTWTARCHGGARFYSAAGIGTGVQLSAGGSSWASISDRAAKENFIPVGREIVDLFAQLPIYNYNLKSQTHDIRHIGPVAQDFNGLFGFTEAKRYINTLDATGVTMAVVRELILENRELKNRIERLEAQWQLYH